MPGTSKVQLNRQSQPNPQETFRYTTPDYKVVANPVDTYVHSTPEKATSTLADELLQTLRYGTFAAEDYGKAKKIADTKAGAAAAARGDDAPSDASSPFLEAYYKFKGEAAAGEYRQRIHEAMDVAAKEGWTPDEWKAANHSLQLEYIKNAPHDAFVTAFADKAIEVETAYNSRYLDDVRKKVDEENRTNIGSAVDLRVNTLFASTKDPDKAMAGLRDIADSVAVDAQKLGVKKEDVWKMLVDNVGRRAEQSARPDLLNFAHIKDANGVSIMHDPDVAGHVDQWTGRAEQAVRSQEAERKRQREEAEKAADRQVLLAINGVFNVPAEERLARVDQLEKWLTKNAGAMDPQYLNTGLKVVRDLRELGNFGMSDAPGMKATLMDKARTLDDTKAFMPLLEAAKPYITPQSYNDVLNLHFTKKEAKTSKEGSQDYRERKETYGSIVHSLGSGFLDVNANTGFMKDAYGREKNAQFRAKMDEWWDAKTTDFSRTGTLPSQDDILKEAIRIRDGIDRAGDPEERTAGPGSNGGVGKKSITDRKREEAKRAIEARSSR